jgi:hypothetical protein
LSVDGIEHLRRAKAELGTEGASPRNRVRGAAREFWRAVFDFESWPPRLQRRAGDLLPRLFKRGMIDDTIRDASDATLAALSDEIKAFCDEAESCDLAPSSAARTSAG